MTPLRQGTRRSVVGLQALALTAAIVTPLLAETVKVRPSKLVAGKGTSVELTVDPNRLLPKPRSEILYAWWCWDIDPRPKECERHYCESPIPDDPICALPNQSRPGELTFEFDDQGKLIDEAKGACGATDFILMARLNDGSVSKAEGTVEIDCGR